MRSRSLHPYFTLKFVPLTERCFRVRILQVSSSKHWSGSCRVCRTGSGVPVLAHPWLALWCKCVRARMRRGQHALGKARWCQSVELVRDFPRAAKQAQIELYLGEQPVIMIKNVVFSVSVAAIFPQMAALLTGSKGGFHGTPLIRHCSEARP